MKSRSEDVIKIHSKTNLLVLTSAIGLWQVEASFGETDGWMDGRTDGWMDGWMDGWTDGRMDGWMDR